MEDDVDTIITCDNGIAAKEEIAYAKRLGMTVIVTVITRFLTKKPRRGYAISFRLPGAVVDPKRHDCEYPFPNLCGAAVAYKLVETLFNVEGRDVEDIDDLMENVAIATVGDVMDLVGENRIFVKQGLEMLKRTSNKGLKALIECTQIPIERLSAYHIGFVLGPCLNASGRLDTAKRALELLNAETKKDAEILAGDLKALNDSRKDMTAQAVEEAIELVEQTEIGKDRVLVIYLPKCHESLAGIVAGRIREKYYKPVFVLTDAEDGVKGSGRSIESYHMYEEMNRCKELFLKFGGHKLAAGLSLTRENVEVFRKRMNENCRLTEDDLCEKVSIDMQLPFAYVNEALVNELECLEPFGKGNPKPVFAEREVMVHQMKILGKNQNVLKMIVSDAQGTKIEALYFGEIKACMDRISQKNGKIHVTYYPDINEYMGRKTPQIIIQNYQ